LKTSRADQGVIAASQPRRKPAARSDDGATSVAAVALAQQLR
jgi:hypothetical protein